MTSEEARRLAEEYARSVPDDVHVPTLAQMIEKNGVAVLGSKKIPRKTESVLLSA